MSFTTRVTGTFTGNGSSAPIRTRGESLVIIGSGNFGAPAGSITLELRLEDGSWQALDISLIEELATPGQKYSKLKVPDNLTVRATLAGATAPALNYILQG